MEQKTKKIIAIIVGVVCIYGAGFLTDFFIGKFKYSRATDRLGSLLGDGTYSTTRLYEELEQRIAELDGYREQIRVVGDNIDDCIELSRQTGSTLGQLDSTVASIGATSTNIGDIIKQLKEGQRQIKLYVNQLETDNRQLEQKLRGIQDSSEQ